MWMIWNVPEVTGSSRSCWSRLPSRCGTFSRWCDGDLDEVLLCLDDGIHLEYSKWSWRIWKWPCVGWRVLSGSHQWFPLEQSGSCGSRCTWTFYLSKPRMVWTAPKTVKKQKGLKHHFLAADVKLAHTIPDWVLHISAESQLRLQTQEELGNSTCFISRRRARVPLASCDSGARFLFFCTAWCASFRSYSIILRGCSCCGALQHASWKTWHAVAKPIRWFRRSAITVALLSPTLCTENAVFFTKCSLARIPIEIRASVQCGTLATDYFRQLGQ